MNRNQFRRDEIAFVEKNKKGESYLYTLADIKARSDASFAKDYLAGKYGAIGNQKIRAAIENAKRLEKYWQEEGKDKSKEITKMNPSVEVYNLIERLLDEIVYLCV